jgi:transposase
MENRLIPSMRADGLEEVLLDNCRTHHAKVVKKLWGEDSHMHPFIFNPPYHPDSNPVEMVFAIIKRYLRKMRPETKAGMEGAIAEAIRSLVTPEKLTNIFRHALRR